MMAVKFVDEEVIDSSRALMWLDVLDELHTARNDVFFGGEDVDIMERTALTRFIQNFLIEYLDYLEGRYQ